MYCDWYCNFIVQDSVRVGKDGENSDELTKQEDEMQNGGREKSAAAGVISFPISDWERNSA
jgi:hypothetical protein